MNSYLLIFLGSMISGLVSGKIFEKRNSQLKGFPEYPLFKIISIMFWPIYLVWLIILWIFDQFNLPEPLHYTDEEF